MLYGFPAFVHSSLHSILLEIIGCYIFTGCLKDYIFNLNTFQLPLENDKWSGEKGIREYSFETLDKEDNATMSGKRTF